MFEFLFGAFKLFTLIGYLFVSAVLLYNQLFSRWMKFSIGFFVLYAVCSFLFFDVFALPFGQGFLVSLPYIFFFVSPLLIGVGLYRGMDMRQMFGGFLLFFLALVLFLISVSVIFGVPFGAYFRLSGLARQWIEMGSLFVLIGGVLGVYGYCCSQNLEGRQTFGVMLLFMVVMLFVMGTIQFTIGYEYLGRSFRAGGLWFPGLNL